MSGLAGLPGNNTEKLKVLADGEKEKKIRKERKEQRKPFSLSAAPSCVV